MTFQYSINTAIRRHLFDKPSCLCQANKDLFATSQKLNGSNQKEKCNRYREPRVHQGVCYKRSHSFSLTRKLTLTSQTKLYSSHRFPKYSKMKLAFVFLLALVVVSQQQYHRPRTLWYSPYLQQPAFNPIQPYHYNYVEGVPSFRYYTPSRPAIYSQVRFFISIFNFYYVIQKEFVLKILGRRRIKHESSSS